MTVSRALRQDPAVAPTTRVKVEAFARDLGYRCDPQISKLMVRLRERRRQASGDVIVGITSVRRKRWAPFLQHAVRSATQRAEELGYGFEVFCIEDPERFNRTLQRTLVSRGIEGLVLLQMSKPARVDALLDWSRFSVVSASVSVIAPTFPQVVANHYANAQEICARLVQRGCKRIGFIGTRTFSERTRRAFESVTVHAGFELGAIIPPLIVAETEGLMAAFRAWFEAHAPDAVIVFAEEWTERLVAEIGIDARRRIAFACTNLSEARSGLGGIDERHDLIGQHAIELLVGQLQRFERGRVSPTSVAVDGVWVCTP